MKKIMAGIVLLAFIFTMAGCGGGGFTIPGENGEKIKISKDGAEIEGTDGSVSTFSNDEDGGFTVKTEEGETKVGEDLDLPKGYPKNILPLYKEEAILSTSIADDGEYYVLYRSKASMKDCVKFYKDLVENIEDKMVSESDDGGMIIATLENRGCAILFSVDSEDSNKTSINLTIGQEVTE